jgi:hypothetical protein
MLSFRLELLEKDFYKKWKVSYADFPKSLFKDLLTTLLGNSLRKNYNKAAFVSVYALIIYLARILCLSYSCLSSCHNCGMLCYSFSFNNQTDSGDEGEGLKREGLKMER